MDHDHGAGNDGSARTCPMKMTFHAGHCETILWKGWLAYTVTEFVFSALAIFVIAFAYEGLKFVREYHLRKVIQTQNDQRIALQSRHTNYNEGSCPNTPLNVPAKPTCRDRILNSAHIVQTLLNLVQIVIAYLLMLFFMLYNYWLCLAVLLGLTLGYFCFGWKKQEVYDNECCN